jgi:hypothetical protein
MSAGSSVKVLVVWGGLIALLGFASTSSADAPLVQVQAKASATAQLPNTTGAFAAQLAVDGNPASSWCATNATGGTGEALTLTFDHPLAIASLEISAGSSALPTSQRSTVDEIDVALTDGRKLHVVRTDRRFIQDVGGAAVRGLTVTISKVHGPSSGAACIRDVSLLRDGGIQYQLYPGAKDALDASETRIVALRTAFERCDGTRLARLVRFPLDRLVRTPHELADVPDVIRIANASGLASKCRENPKAWYIGGSVDDNLAWTRFFGPRSALVTGGARWWLDWDGAQWWLVGIE